MVKLVSQPICPVADTRDLPQALRQSLSDKISEVVVFRDEVTLVVPREHIIEVLTHLRDVQQFNMLTDETCVDYYPREPRFGILYQLYSLPRNLRLRVKVMLSEYDPKMPTAVGVPQRQLVRTRDLRLVRHSLRGTPRSAPHPAAGQLARSSIAQRSAGGRRGERLLVQPRAH